MTAPLKDRLRAMYSHRGDGIPTQHRNPDGEEAADYIEKLEAELAALRPAPFWRKPMEPTDRRRRFDWVLLAMPVGAALILGWFFLLLWIVELV